MTDETFKIKEITYDKITFTNGKTLTHYHEQYCCESVYADFEAIDDLACEYEFTEPLQFEEVRDYGFIFGNPGRMVSVPCYNVQNGYYSSDLTIRYDGEVVIEDCELKDEIY